MLRHQVADGAIVNLSSIAANRPLEDDGAVYGCSKSAVDNLTRYLSLHLGRHNIRVNSVQPSGVQTQMVAQVLERKGLTIDDALRKDVAGIPLLQQPQDVADVVLFLLSDAARRVSGVHLLVDGGTAR